jgi:hypothetical protein
MVDFLVGPAGAALAFFIPGVGLALTLSAQVAGGSSCQRATGST